MQFPHLGKHCNEITCNRLDFLPMKCDACNKVFCSSHFNYDKHACSDAHKKDVQVPVCPLCGEIVPTPPGVAPDLTVGQHLDKQCKSDTRKIFTNRCTYKGCKRKELIPVTCAQCKMNFCLRHRHTADHECSATALTANKQHIFNNMSKADERAMVANAAEYRRSHKPTSLFDVSAKPSLIEARAAVVVSQTASSAQVQNIQGNISEDEALARALALSIMELDETADRNRRNELAAAATRNTPVQVGGRDAQNNSSKDRCSLS